MKASAMTTSIVVLADSRTYTLFPARSGEAKWAALSPLGHQVAKRRIRECY